MFYQLPTKQVKRAQSDSFNFFFKLLEILVSQESSYFSEKHGTFHSSKVFHLKEINENMPGYTGNCNIQNCFLHANDLTVSAEILNAHLFILMILQT